MRFQITTDYAIRIILFLAEQGNRISTAKEAAKELGLTYAYFNKVASKIRMAGFIESVQGKKGGYRLAKNPANITIYDIIEAMEGGICINRCMEQDGYCSRSAVHICPMHRLFAFLQLQIIGTLKSVRVCDLVSEKDVLEAEWVWK